MTVPPPPRPRRDDKYLLRRLRTKSDWNPLSEEEKKSPTALAKTTSRIDRLP